MLANIIELFSYHNVIFFIIASFFIGSIPFGLIITRISGYGDIRKIGSGNIGATNVLRTGNKFLAILTLCLDLLKSFTILYLVKINFEFKLEENFLILLYAIIALLSLLGHMFSPFILFKGGKGIATAAGILFFINWFLAAFTLFIWLIMAIKFKTSSIGALTASFICPILFWFLYKSNFIKNIEISILEVYLVLIITILIWVKHIPNIKRLIAGTETKI